MLKHIGNTPMIKIKYKNKDRTNFVYAKLESYNLTGSIKDRVAYYIINRAKERGELKKNMPIVEATSGNTGIALSALGAYYKHPVYIYMPDWASTERVQLMKSFGANVTLISKEQGGFKKCLEEAEKFAKENNGYWSNQFANTDNLLAHYETTGEEIIKQLPETISAFISGVGTGGTLIGIIGNHKIEGIGDDFVPDLLDKNLLDDVILVNDDDAINMSRLLAKKLGLGVGISSGANLIASIIYQEKENKPVVTVFADDNKKYLSTDLSKDLDNNFKYVSNKIELLDYMVV